MVYRSLQWQPGSPSAAHAVISAARGVDCTCRPDDVAALLQNGSCPAGAADDALVCHAKLVPAHA